MAFDLADSKLLGRYLAFLIPITRPQPKGQSNLIRQAINAIRMSESNLHPDLIYSNPFDLAPLIRQLLRSDIEVPSPLRQS